MFDHAGIFVMDGYDGLIPLAEKSSIPGMVKIAMSQEYQFKVAGPTTCSLKFFDQPVPRIGATSVDQHITGMSFYKVAIDAA